MLDGGCRRRLLRLQRRDVSLRGLSVIFARPIAQNAFSVGAGLSEGPLLAGLAFSGRVVVVLIGISGRLRVRRLVGMLAMADVNAPIATRRGPNRRAPSVVFSRRALTSQIAAGGGLVVVETATTGRPEVFAVIAMEIAIVELAIFLAIGTSIGLSGKRRVGLRRPLGRRARLRARGQT